jgi:hypothetical protein
MWEHRLIWTADPPPWWDATWTAAREALRRHGRQPEDRPDTYLVLADRPDVGLKLRGKAGEFEVKVRHDARDNWELWEKIPFFVWNDLEAARLSALLQREFPAAAIDTKATPVEGVKALLGGAGVAWREMKIDKTRMQARAGDILAPLWAGVDPAWLLELVTIDGAGATARSICFEAMGPNADVARALPDAGAARNIGYPEYLIRAMPG